MAYTLDAMDFLMNSNGAGRWCCLTPEISGARSASALGDLLCSTAAESKKMANTLPIAAEFHLHPLHPACVEIGTLREQLAEAKSQLGRPFVMERGPWVASDDGLRLYSDDFQHDASLTVGGDFGSDETRKDYADELARRLNRAA